MAYKNPADKAETILYWENEKKERFGVDLNSRRSRKHSRREMCFSKIVDITPSDIETIKSQYENCVLKVDKHSQNFDIEVGAWIDCEPFLRVYIDADGYIPLEIEGQKIVPSEANVKLLERVFWQIVKKETIEPLSEEEARINKLALLG